MSELAFDKEGNPFRFSRRTKKLRPRRWKNPGQRGTCAAVLNADGEQLLIDADAEYVEFRTAVGNVPGFYRLDQCDEDGASIEDAPPAYVSIDVPRNAAPSGEADPRDAIIRDLAQINAEVTRTIAERFSNVMQAAADILRAADGAGLSRRQPPPPPAPAPPPEDDEDEDDDDEDDDDDDDSEDAESTAAAKLWTIVEPVLPAIKMWIATMVAKRTSTPAPVAPAPPPPSAAAPAPTAPAPTAPAPAAPFPAAPVSAAPAPTTPHAAPADVGAAQSAPPVPAPPPPVSAPAAPPASAAAPAPNSPPPAAEQNQTATDRAGPQPPPGPADAADAGSGITALAETPRNVTSLEPTPEQWEHLWAIRARLSPRESAIAEIVVLRMPLEMRAEWLAELSAFPPDEAAEIVRSMIPQPPPKQPGAGNGTKPDGQGGPD